MKIAVTYDNGQVFQHFGHTEEFAVYEVEDDKVIGKTILGSGDSGHGALATLLEGEGIETLICGGIGGGAQEALKDAGVKYYGGVTGDADKAVEDLLAGTLNFDPDVHCTEHEEGHEHGESCGNHGGSCGNH